jgi:hypothetical protein
MDDFNITLNNKDILCIAAWLDSGVGDIDNILKKIYSQAKTQNAGCHHKIFINNKCITCGRRLRI